MTEDIECKTADRCHVDSLLDISEESFANVSMYRLPVQSAWEQVVKGWNDCPPLACLFQLPNKCKPIKTGEHEFHCLLCTDANLSQKLEEHWNIGTLEHRANSQSSETNCSLAEGHECKNRLFPTMHQESCLTLPPEEPCSDSDTFKYEKKTTESCKITGRAKLHRLPDTLPKLTYMKLAVQCPIMKEKEIIKKFSVLPSVRGSDYPKGTRLRCVVASTLSSSVMTKSYGLPLTREGHVEGETVSPGDDSGAGVLEDSHRSLTSKCYQFPPRKQLSTFSISLLKRCGSSNPFEDTLSLAADLVGRKIKHDGASRVIVNKKLSHNQKLTDNELPSLCGTRFPIQVMSHHTVYTSNARLPPPFPCQ